MTIYIAEGDIAARTRAIIADLRFLEGPLLPILHEVQDEFGYIPQEAVPVIAEELNLSRAEVHAVMMATPDDLEDFAVGFSLTEGIITERTEIAAIEIVEGEQGIDVQVSLVDDVADRLRARRRSMQTEGNDLERIAAEASGIDRGH